ncbi:30S ribosomal protein S8e [Halosegnis rubeus]|jgi:small subunit ribosomal protein S8e|uniref:Small ribosomal subunit protein eS8 n=1 Tax=Halosegnis rubeus TaxID=2212850 RepID=A0A5N5UI33_9EURY|nr:30S ribosomal protein S8e [Halosegnis rubeus]KAB7515713.1 30S ribosomal protein S8e [Halosegnis rubeus]KAB7517072.1 30S ribosomal protein S8e [Halosegnis rubeus]KAB7519800.1 30S ribosomal protein S8e [Halosegnis rubeus]
MKSHGRSTTKRTGGRRRTTHKKRKHELGNSPTETTVGDKKLKVVETRGGNTKVRAIESDTATVATGDGETVSTTIENVAENDADPNYVRRNIITKGAVIETPEGDARVTSRPGQDGQVNAVLVE